MNNLSWLIYLASVVPNLSGFIITIMIVVSAALSFWALAVAMHNDDYRAEEVWEYPKFKVFIPLIFLLGLIASLIPDKQTIYLIAGSEAGEYVVNTPEAQEIMNDIHSIIKLQLKEYTK